MNTGQFGASPVPGRLMPMLAAFDSPGSLDDAAHDREVFDVVGALPRRHLCADGSCVRSASSWNVLLVVRPQPGQAVTLGAKARIPSDCSSSHAA